MARADPQVLRSFLSNWAASFERGLAHYDVGSFRIFAPTISHALMLMASMSAHSCS